MKIFVKIILSIILFLIGFFFMGVPIPYFFGRILFRSALFTAALYGIYSIWKKRPNKGSDKENPNNVLNKN